MSDKPEEAEVIDDQKSVNEVVADDKPVVPEKKEESKQEPEPKPPAEDLSKLRNVVAYQTRTLEKALKELRETQAEIQSLRQTPAVPSEDGKELDEADRIAQADWKKGVLHVVEKRLQEAVGEALSRQQQAQLEFQKRSFLEGELDKSRKRVTEKYPEVNTEGTEENRLFLEVLNEDSTLLSNVHGPELAMRRMEDKMLERGMTPRTVRPTVEKEAQRLARAGASNVIGRTRLSKAEIPLTSEQKEFIKRYNLDEKEYRKNLQSDTSRGAEA